MAKRLTHSAVAALRDAMTRREWLADALSYLPVGTGMLVRDIVTDVKSLRGSDCTINVYQLRKEIGALRRAGVPVDLEGGSESQVAMWLVPCDSAFALVETAMSE